MLKAIVVDKVENHLDKPGAIEFRLPYGIAFVCPCGCKNHAWIPVHGNLHSWKWNGNMNAPSVSPSIKWGNHWHGYLTDGEWKPC
jgi:hypothetical protein